MASTRPSSTSRTPVRVAGDRRSAFVLAGIAIAAMAVVVAFVVYQSTTGASNKVPPRTITSDSRTLGDASAPVTIVEYADFQCPICKNAETSIIPSLEKDYIQTGKAKLEFRFMPIIGQESWNAAQAAYAAADQGKFWEYHDALYNAQGTENGGNFTLDKLVALAGTLGLDTTKFGDTLRANTHLADIQKERDAASGVTSTPTFFISNGKTDKKIEGVLPYATFKATIDDALAKAGQ